MEIIVGSSEFFDGRVATGIPVDGDVVNSGNLLNLGWDSFVRPTESKVRKSINCEFWWHNARIALNRGICCCWKSLVVLESNLHIVFAGIIDFLKKK